LISPLTLLRSVPLFAIPSVAMAIVLYWSIPVVDRAGVPLLWNVLVQSGILLAALGAFAVTMATRQRWPGTSARERLKLAPCRLTDLAIGLLVGGIGLWSYLQLQFTVPWLMQRLPFGPPSWTGRFVGDGTFLDTPLAGAWWVLAVYAVFYLCNVVGEELWWRGYILPRQRAAMGSWAWVANGLLWACFHVFFAWDVVTLIPMGLLIALTTQWRGSTWVAIIAHGVLNLLPWFTLVPAVMIR
jgi:membrane protease YdiL (CAAX protease family)